MQKHMTAQDKADMAWHDAKELEHKVRIVAAAFASEGNHERATAIWLIASAIHNTADMLLLNLYDKQTEVMHHPV